MDKDRKINFCEGVPLNSSGAANIFLNAGKNVKPNSHDGTVIHLKTEKPTDVGVHINTTFSIASSKKVKLLFVLNFLLSVLCMVISCSVAFYYWHEMIAMRKQVDTLREQYFVQNLGVSQVKPEQSPLVAQLRPQIIGTPLRESRMEKEVTDSLLRNIRTYYVENLGEDMLLVDSSKKTNLDIDKPPTQDLSRLIPKDLLVIHFNGAMREQHLGTQSIIGPWARDTDVSTKDSDTKIELNANYFTIKETGLYLVYVQVVYLSRAPNCFFVWARQPGLEPRLVSTCASAGDGSGRPLDKSQISCNTQTVARLYKGDTVNIAQREQNRTLWLRPGYTYFGFIKLSS